ncbi:MAG: GTPase HflX [Candidatus Hadarchaeia archaeon]
MKVVLVERLSNGDSSKMSELAALARTLDHEIVGELTQRRKPDPTYHIGKGKVEELRDLVSFRDAELVIFANPLKPSQAFKLEEKVGVKVIDRFQLILRIFAMRAGSPEAKLQVEYARLNYELPRVKERVKRAKLDEFPGLRGGGEYGERARVDTVKKRMKTLENKLESFEDAREERRKRRRERGFELVALAGYTNAGKSTLLNKLSTADVEVDDRLFTTLSPRTRVLEGSSQKILITDTVGFIDDLPPWLIEAFKAAIEEIYLADLILLVVDASESFREILRKYRTSREILSDASAPMITVMNKIDNVSEESLSRKIDALRRISPDTVKISAEKEMNLKTLLDEINSRLLERIRARLTTHEREGIEKLLHRIYENGKVENVNYSDPTEVTFWTDERNLGKIRGILDENSKIEKLEDSS